MRAIVLWPVLGVVLMAAIGLLIPGRPRAVKAWTTTGRRGRRSPAKASDLHTSASTSSPASDRGGPTCCSSRRAFPRSWSRVWAGKLASHQPFWSPNQSIYHWFAQEGPKVPLLLDVFRFVTRLGEPIVMLIVCTVACFGLVLLAKERRWLGPALVALAFVVERYVQKAIGVIVNQPHPPTAGSGFPSEGSPEFLRSMDSLPTSTCAWASGTVGRSS